ncbi:hypothetical protein SKAU_G00094800 [Synaphobranchus kaupii]|uniref:Uncharacterized protein n=1 Tax=Synaphobranchus kaupii TaxID=118154 RepID=A0A9Q1J5S5_SYNKA|nr:hypothetical protein SKAU_G00094800 [Synaphobranchus kaupii]
MTTSYHFSAPLTSPSNPPPPTHKAGNLLDLVFQRNSPCSDLTAHTPISSLPVDVRSPAHLQGRSSRSREDVEDLSSYQSLLAAFSTAVTAAKGTLH